MTAAILEQLNQPLVIDEVHINPLEFGQVHVKVLASGICGAQLQDIRGEKGNAKYLPQLLGHEGCGEVLEVGPGVTRLKPGDKCILHWRKGLGAEGPLPRYGDRRQISAGHLATFCTEAVCSENRLTKVPSTTPTDLCALLGCGLSTALATIEQEAKLKWGESILIVGVGGLGSNLIRAAKMARAGHIVAMDVHENKRMVALALGAGFVVADDPSLAAGMGFDVIVDTAGTGTSMERTLPWLAPSGRYIMVGHPAPGMDVTIKNADHLFGGEGKTIKATQGGGFNPSVDAPRYARLAADGVLDIAGIISHRLPLANINEGLELVRAGQASRILIDMSL